jgi:hypothetical protein
MYFSISYRLPENYRLKKDRTGIRPPLTYCTYFSLFLFESRRVLVIFGLYCKIFSYYKTVLVILLVLTVLYIVLAPTEFHSTVRSQLTTQDNRLTDQPIGTVCQYMLAYICWIKKISTRYSTIKMLLLYLLQYLPRSMKCTASCNWVRYWESEKRVILKILLYKILTLAHCLRQRWLFVSNFRMKHLSWSYIKICHQIQDFEENYKSFFIFKLPGQQ